MVQKKPLVLFFPLNLLSHYSRCLQLSSFLKDDYEIYFPYSILYNELLKKAKVKTFSFNDFDTQTLIDDAGRFSFQWMKYENIENLFLQQVSIIRYYKPLFVVGDNAFTLKMACDYCKVPWVSVINAYMSKYYNHTHPLPNKWFFTRLINQLPSKIYDPLAKRAEKFAFRIIHKPFKIVRNKYQLPVYYSWLDELEGDKTFLCDLPDLFPQKKLPRNYHFIGPLNYNFSCNKNDEYVNNIIQRLNSDKPNILVSMGSTGSLKKLSFLNEKPFEQFNIIVCGDYYKILFADHIFSYDFLDFNQILPKMHFLVCHGGNGTIYQALTYGVPLVCFPSIFEQEWNALAISKNNLGFCFFHKPKSETLAYLLKKPLSLIMKKQLKIYKDKLWYYKDNKMLKDHVEAFKEIFGNKK